MPHRRMTDPKEIALVEKITHAASQFEAWYQRSMRSIRRMDKLKRSIHRLTRSLDRLRNERRTEK